MYGYEKSRMTARKSKPLTTGSSAHFISKMGRGDHDVLAMICHVFFLLQKQPKCKGYF
jgi:hypothetical protein